MEATYLGEISMPDPLPGAPGMTEGEFTVGTFLYFERCAGCHGALRQGSTGGAITPNAEPRTCVDNYRDSGAGGVASSTSRCSSAGGENREVHADNLGFCA